MHVWRRMIPAHGESTRTPFCLCMYIHVLNILLVFKHQVQNARAFAYKVGMIHVFAHASANAHVYAFSVGVSIEAV